MIDVTVRKGHDLNISGRPEHDLEVIETPPRLAVLPEHIPFVIPRLRVEPGDQVKIGTVLFEDKRDTSLVFLSPGAGVIEDIRYGKRRVIREIVIRLDEEEDMEHFPKTDSAELELMDGPSVINLLVNGGLWPCIRELPFRDIASRQQSPSSVIVSLDARDSCSPSPHVYLQGRVDLFLFGLSILRRIASTIHVMISGPPHDLPDSIKEQITHRVHGSYPCDDPGVLLYHIKKSQEENRAFYVNGQDLVLMAGLVRDGVYPTRKIIAVGGAGSEERKHFNVRIGTPLESVIGEVEDAMNVVAGGVMRGYSLSPDSFLGYYESSLTLLPRGDEEEFFGFLRPGYRRQSYSRTFLSLFNRSALPMDCGMHGDLRPCINCGSCASVCPVDILPQFTFKCIQADEVEEYLAHGLLDCVECGLCTYVCPCKIDVCDILKTARAVYYKERA